MHRLAPVGFLVLILRFSLFALFCRFSLPARWTPSPRRCSTPAGVCSYALVQMFLPFCSTFRAVPELALMLSYLQRCLHSHDQAATAAALLPARGDCQAPWLSFPAHTTISLFVIVSPLCLSLRVNVIIIVHFMSLWMFIIVYFTPLWILSPLCISHPCECSPLFTSLFVNILIIF